jgi:hypothetical protein
MTLESSGITVAVLQPGYLPWLGFFDQMRRADIFVLYDDVQYDKHGWRNRNRIKTPTGPMWLTVPVLHTGRGPMRIDEVEVDPRSAWSQKHVKSLRQNYAKAAHARPYLQELEETLLRSWERLVDLDMAVTSLMAEWLGLASTVVRSSGLRIAGERSERLVNVCRHFGARTYLTGDAARSYLDVALFESAGIQVVWQVYRHPVYPQLHGPFASHLSAIDLILNCGPDARTILANSDAGPLPLARPSVTAPSL